MIKPMHDPFGKTISGGMVFYKEASNTNLHSSSHCYLVIKYIISLEVKNGNIELYQLVYIYFLELFY